ncbi:flagellar hook assembly protein FlgD [Sutcliffiella cohnii]
MTKITSDLYIENIPTATNKQNDIMGKDDFLRLLIAQLQNQDPLNPMEDREFIAQMANFSTLEQMTNLNKSMESFVENQHMQNILSLQHYIGKEVSWEETVSEGDTQTVINNTNIVKSISLKNGLASFLLDNDKEVSIYQINSVTNPIDESSNSIISASHLIGKKVSINWKNDELNDLEVTSVLTKAGQTFITVNNDALLNEKIPLNSLIRISN